MKRLFLLPLVLACTVTDTGNPPNSPEIDPMFVENVSTSTTGATDVQGGPGAIVPPRGVVRIVPLRGGAARTATVQPDGSFFAQVDVADGSGPDLIRLQAIDGALRSDPIDINMSGVAPPAPECLIMPSWQSVALDDTGASEFALLLTNECDAPLEFGALTMRIPMGPLVLEPVTPSSLPAGESMEVAIRVRRTAAAEGVLFMPIMGAMPTTRAITLVVQPPDI